MGIKAINMLGGIFTFVLVLAEFHSISVLSIPPKAEVPSNPISFKNIISNLIEKENSEGDRILENFVEAEDNPDELGTHFEGDIFHPKDLLRNGLIEHNFHWNGGVVPIELRGDFNSKELNTINNAFEMYHKYTCIRFIQHSNENDYVTITKKPNGCWSSLGRIGGQQILNLQAPMCVQKVGTPLHELMHVLGFNHEHTRADRDEYIQIEWDNISTEKYGNFGKASPNTTNTFDVEYDYNSVMHYSPFAFAVDPAKPTITALKQDRSENMGQRDGLSKADITKIWRMYNCTTTTKP